MNIFQQVKAVFKIKGALKNMKLSELKTSEGRMMLLMNAIGIWSAVYGFIPAPLMIKISAASVLGYGLLRAAVKFAEAIAKVTPTLKDDAIVAEAVKVLEAIAPLAPAAPKEVK